MITTKPARTGNSGNLPEILTPFISVAVVTGLLSVAAIVAALVLPDRYVPYLTFLPAAVPLLASFFLWRLLAPSIGAVMAVPGGAATLVAEERGQGGMPSTGDGHDGRKPAGALSTVFTDPLTGLANRSRMHEKFRRLVEGAGNGPVSFTIGLVDIDGMKPINDLFGQKGGNEVLKQCAARLAAAVEDDGFVCRYGGDEFGFIFPGVSDERKAAEKGGLLQSVLLAPFDLEGSAVRLSGSFGFAVYPQSGETIDEIMSSIDTALYHSKRHGRGRVTVYSRELEDFARENARLEQALRSAVANNEVAPHFQPIISLQDGRLLGFEALARWMHPELGSVAPAKFIPLAEERGIIAPLTESPAVAGGARCRRLARRPLPFVQPFQRATRRPCNGAMHQGRDPARRPAAAQAGDRGH